MTTFERGGHMAVNNSSEFAGLDALGIADVVMAAAMLRQSSKSNKINSDNISENKKIVSLLNEINENEKTIISLLRNMVEDDKH